MAKTNNNNSNFDVTYFMSICNCAMNEFEVGNHLFNKDDLEDFRYEVICAYLQKFERRIPKHGLEADRIWDMTYRMFSQEISKKTRELNTCCNGGNLFANSSNKVRGKSIVKVVAC